jgi:hypothetical protein
LAQVREVWIFGSYARGALEVGDVDLAVEFDQTKDEAGRWIATLMAGGFDHLGALRRELRGNQRALEIHCNELDDPRKEGFEPQLLWRRGGSLEGARARLQRSPGWPQSRCLNTHLALRFRSLGANRTDSLKPLTLYEAAQSACRRTSPSTRAT